MRHGRWQSVQIARRNIRQGAPTECCAVSNGWTIVAGDKGGRVHILALEM